MFSLFERDQYAAGVWNSDAFQLAEGQTAIQVYLDLSEDDANSEKSFTVRVQKSNDDGDTWVNTIVQPFVGPLVTSTPDFGGSLNGLAGWLLRVQLDSVYPLDVGLTAELSG